MARSYSAMNPMGKDFMTDQEQFNARAQQQADAANAQRAQNVSNMEFAAGDRAAFQRAAQEFSAGESALGRAQQTSMQQGGPGMMNARLNERKHNEARADSAIKRGMQQDIFAQAAGQMGGMQLNTQQMNDMALGMVSPGMGIAAMQGRQQDVQWGRAQRENRADRFWQMSMATQNPTERHELQQMSMQIREGGDPESTGVPAPRNLAGDQATYDRTTQVQNDNTTLQSLTLSPGPFSNLREDWEIALQKLSDTPRGIGSHDLAAVNELAEELMAEAVANGVSPEGIQQRLKAELDKITIQGSRIDQAIDVAAYIPSLYTIYRMGASVFGETEDERQRGLREQIIPR